ncbi:hypothetical protein [Pseudonocardia acaciae]|uniref:hypothetical protein n=1 Tax=Pseudonocardia acaciae TaxID=551276 RepID=UPI00048A5F59|nr:hypothetical protein [Pseudonocardia acaciae]
MVDDLGALRERYDTDNGRRGRVALAALLLGVVVTPLSVLFAIPMFASGIPIAMLGAGILIGLGIRFVFMGWWLRRLFATRSGEVFELHTDGLVHSYRDERRVVRWADITQITGTIKDTILAVAFGPAGVRLRLAHGEPVLITGLTEGAEDLVAAVRKAVDQA